MPVIVLRSLIFNVLFYVNLVIWLIAAIPTFAMPRGAILSVAKSWARLNNWLLRVVCDTRIVYRGVENIPSGPLIIAAKHQSMWETFALLPFFDEPLYILKRELLRIPFFGWYLAKADMIGVDRRAGGRALLAMAKRASDAIRAGRQLIVFPEGTRRPVGAPPDYKPGVAQIYHDSGVQCLPVALNSGMFWPRRNFLRYPGTLIVEFLDPLPPGIPRREFVAVVAERIEAATARIVAEAQADDAPSFRRA